MRFGMIGAGFIARPNGAALIAQPSARLAAIANPTLAKAEQVARDLGAGCPVYADWRDMLDREQLDAVLINLPHHLHHDVFIACAERGLHIIIEKALANTYVECRDMIEAARRCGIRATVCHTQRYNAVFQAAKDYIAAHELGPLLSISDNIHTHYFWEGRSSWQLSNEQSGGGIALNYGVHQLDRVHFFLGQKTVQFTARYLAEKPGYTILSSYVMMGVGDGGTPYVITCSGYSGPNVDEMRLVFANGILQCCLRENGLYASGLYFGDTASGRFTAQPVPLSQDGYFQREFSAAVHYLSGETDQAPVPLEWGAEMVRLVETGFSGQTWQAKPTT